MKTEINTAGSGLPPHRGRANNFDFLRLVLALLVIFSHSFEMVSGQLSADPFYRLMHGQMSGGALAVDFFFVLSGYLVVKSWQQSRTAGDYVRKRALRIYPGFAVVLAFCVFVVGPLGGADHSTYFKTPQTYKFFEMLLFRPSGRLPGVFAGLPNAGVIDASLWTIRFELMCYIAVLALGLANVLKRRGAVLTLFLLMYLWLNLGPDLPLNVPFLGSLEPLPRLLMYFFAGSIFYLYRQEIGHRRVLLVLSAVAVLASTTRGLNWTLPIFGAYALFHVAFSNTLRVHQAGRFGDFSYGLYLYGYPVQQLLVQKLGVGVGGALIFVLSSTMTLALAVLSWYCVERPFLKLKPAPQPRPVASGGWVAPAPASPAVTD